MKSACFSLREKLSAEPTDEGLMHAMRRCEVEPQAVIDRPSSDRFAATFSLREKDVKLNLKYPRCTRHHGNDKAVGKCHAH